jgi:8-oxo-dGTP pyrophosphatase MutT (NUDIX family)
MTALRPPAIDPLRVLEARLRGTLPGHGREVWRLGAALAVDVLPELDALMPAAPAPAAVLVGIVGHVADPALLLTVRASQLRSHGGQIAFPGGRIEAADPSPADAAMREAHEEIGLAPADIEILGYLPDHLVLTGYRVTPVVARLRPGAALRVDANEVEQVFELPWSVLEDDASILVGERIFGGVPVPVRDIHFAGHRIWGLTAAVLLLLRDLVRGAA